MYFIFFSINIIIHRPITKKYILTMEDSSMTKAMSDDSSGTMKTVWRISYGSNSSSKSLGLCGASVFSLVWLGDRLVGDLACTGITTISTKNSTMVGNQWSMMDNRGMVSNERGMVSNDRGMVSNERSMVDNWGMMNNRGMSNYSSWSIAWNTFIGDILDIS